MTLPQNVVDFIIWTLTWAVLILTLILIDRYRKRRYGR